LWPNGGNYDIVQSIRARAQAHSIEAKAFTVVSSAYLTDDVKELIADGDKRIREVMDNTPRSASMVIGPNGEQMGEIRQNEEGIIYADINIADCVVPKQFHDVVGYYNRFDIFKLTVNRSSNDPINFDAADQERGTVNTDLAAFGEASASADSRSLVGQDIS
jgi:Predicted amidohydrolase